MSEEGQLGQILIREHMLMREHFLHKKRTHANAGTLSTR
jgi:hypothetical protein